MSLYVITSISTFIKNIDPFCWWTHTSFWLQCSIWDVGMWQRQEQGSSPTKLRASQDPVDISCGLLETSPDELETELCEWFVFRKAYVTQKYRYISISIHIYIIIYIYIYYYSYLLLLLFIIIIISSSYDYYSYSHYYFLFILLLLILLLLIYIILYLYGIHISWCEWLNY